ERFGEVLRKGVLASTSICFDLSVFEIFAPLSVGGKVILALNALELGEIVGRDGVSLVNTVPSAMGALMRGGSIPESVEQVYLAGEALGRGLVDGLYELEHIRGVVNLYGPSEDTTYSTWALIERGEKEKPSIGRPVMNTRALVLDKRLGLAPIGVAGELW